MDLHLTIPYAVVAIGSVLLFIAAFHGKTSRGPWSIRSVFLIAPPFGITWSILGLYLQLHHTDHGTNLNWDRFWLLSHLKSTIGGVTLGILITLVINPEFYRAMRKEIRTGLTNRSS